MRSNVLFINLLRSVIGAFVFFAVSTSLIAEGTKQFDPSSSDLTMIFTNFTGYDNFMRYEGPEETRLNIHIADPENEILYIGLGEGVDIYGEFNGSTYYFRIKDPAGNVVYGPQAITPATANASSYALVTAGPEPVVGASGYTPFTFDPAGLSAGDYYVEVSNQPGNTASTSYVSLRYFDFTVATKTATPTAIDGRLWSKKWALRTPPIPPVNTSLDNYNRPFNGTVYSYSEDGFVNAIDFFGSEYQGLSFEITFNSHGASNTGNVAVDRRSVEGSNTTEAEYKIFLNNPDPSIYPSGIVGSVDIDPLINSCNPSKLCIQYSVTAEGLAEILLDYDQTSGAGIYDPNTADVLIIEQVTAKTGEEAPYSRCVAWNGLDGLGNTVDISTPQQVVISFSQGINHFSSYDVEFLKTGYAVTGVRPAPLPGFGQFLYYDDSNIPDDPANGAPQTAFEGCSAPCHGWDEYTYGNLNTINTWWYTNQDKRTNPTTPSCIPTANDDFAATTVGVPVSIDIIANDEGDNLDIASITLKNTSKNGTVSFDPVSGVATFTPNPGVSGVVHFEYVLCNTDDPAICEDALVEITVNGIDPIDDDNVTSKDTPVSGNLLTNDRDFEGDNLVINTTPKTAPTNGSVVINPDGTYTYTPTAGFVGKDVFEYEVCDDATPSACETAKVTIDVKDTPMLSANNGVIANDDDNRTKVDTPVSGSVLTNDADIDGDNLVINTTPITGPTNGTVVINPDGTYTYTPDPLFTGNDTFEYEVCDDGTPQECTTAKVTISVDPKDYGPNPNLPFAGDDFGLTSIDTPITDGLWVNDSEGTDPSVTPVTTPTNGTLVINTDSTYTYTPNPGYTGPDQFVYTTCVDTDCVDATVYLFVMPAPADPPSDIDEDDDGIPDTREAYSKDHDNDGTPDSEDPDFCAATFQGVNGWDCATDGLPDPEGDLDGDGTPNKSDADFPYTIADTDNDGIPDHKDLDADNDGIPDLVEVGGIDEDGDGIVDDLTDTDGDGFADAYDNNDTDGPSGDGSDTTTPSTSELLDADKNGTAEKGDSDGDGLADFIDLDADNDGIPDLVEAGGIDTNGDGRVDVFADVDSDGYTDTFDSDDNLTAGDEDLGTPLLETTPTGEMVDGATSKPVDTDKDGKPDHLDLDADNDGIPDVIEAGGIDEDGDGMVDSSSATWDQDKDGLADQYDQNASDGPGTAGTDGKSLVKTTADTDGDGRVTATETMVSGGGGVLFNINTDGDNKPNHLDLDADNDGLPDLVEAGGIDTNGDGRVDTFNDVDNDGYTDLYDSDDNMTVGDEDLGTPLVETTPTGEMIAGATSKPLDSDKDGKPDHLDLDADNDGLPDVLEVGGIDEDGDGMVDTTSPTWDVDEDGLADKYDENASDGPGTAGTNGTSLVETTADTDGDGRVSATETMVAGGGGILTNINADTDPKPNHLDLDADNDGIPDLVEAGGIDDNGDGRIDKFLDNDNDGYSDAFDSDNNLIPGDEDLGTPLVETTATGVMIDGVANNTYDKDGDGFPDHLDVDADNDGIPDLIEAGGTDPEGDGMVDFGAAPWDADEDGLADIFDENASDGPGFPGVSGTALVETTPDTNGDGRVNATETMIAGGGGSNNINADGDTVPNHLDLDADNDGILDITEAGGTDTNGDGIFDGTMYGDNGYNDSVDPTAGNDPLIKVNADVAGDTDPRDEYTPGGATDAIADSDGDDVPDFLDVDADNDGIYDNYEGQSTAGYIAPTGIDVDNDGVDDNYDQDITSFGATTNGTPGGITPYNHDGAADNPDYLDLDADDDGISDMTEAWDHLADGDSQIDNSVDPTTGDTDGDGLLDAFDMNDADPLDFAWENTPPSDNAMGDDGNAASTGTPFDASATLDELLPNNGGTNTAEPDYRSTVDCSTPQVYYAITEQGTASTEYEFNGTMHVDGAGSKVIRVTQFCEPDADGWYYFYNPMEENNYLFAVRNSATAGNTIPMSDLIDYIELRVDPTPTNRHQTSATDATLVLERDWNLVTKQVPNGNLDVKFYYTMAEAQALDVAADAIEGNYQTRNPLMWFVADQGSNISFTNADISPSMINNMVDITAKANVVVDENIGTASTDGTTSTTGNAKNYVMFTDLVGTPRLGSAGTSVSLGGTAVIQLSGFLPIELVSFKSTVNNCVVTLNWEAAAETDFSHYELERSTNGFDYKSLQIVKGTGSASTSQAYQFIDRTAETTNYYRLKLVDNDGTIKYSNVIEATTDCAGVENGLEIYPNPVGDYYSEISVKFYTANSRSNFVITDVLGRRVKDVQFDTSRGWNIVNINIQDLAIGTYFLVDTNNTESIAHKFVKIKE